MIFTSLTSRLLFLDTLSGFAGELHHVTRQVRLMALAAGYGRVAKQIPREAISGSIAAMSRGFRSKRALSAQVRVPLLVKLVLFAGALLAIWWVAFSPPATPPTAAEPGAAEATPSPSPAARQAPSQADPRAAPPALSAPAAQEHDQPQPSAAEAPSGPAPRAAAPLRQGPVDELAQRFASESRGDGSEREETRVKEAFVDPQIPSTLLQSVECRRSVCRLQLRWSPEHDPGYVLGLTRAVGSFSAPLGIDEPGAADAHGQRPLLIYFGLSR